MVKRLIFFFILVLFLVSSVSAERVLVSQSAKKRISKETITDFKISTESFVNKAEKDLQIKVEPLWIINGFAADLTETQIQFLEENYAVQIEEDEVVHLLKEDTNKAIYLSTSEKIVSDPIPQWNIRMVRAPKCWEMGYKGQGIVVGNIDTGVYPWHEVFGDRFTGVWYDAVNHRTDPYDDHGHGTHTMGILCGTLGFGVAPEATFIALKAFDAYGAGYSSDILECYQVIVDLYGTANFPDVINNSWGCVNQVETCYWDALELLRELGCINVFAIGNTGPGRQSTNSPGNYPQVIAAGAVTSDTLICNFSSRGPAPCVDPWNIPELWPDPEWYLYKPDLSAPGFEVWSALPDNNFRSWSGTSMACPHVAGAAAILLSQCDTLSFYTVWKKLTDAAIPQGEKPNHNYGWGFLDIYAALDDTTGPEQDLEIKSIVDVPNDSGKQVEITWYASKRDPGKVIDYSIYRKIDARGSGIKDWPPGEWEFIETVPAWGESSYVAIAPTIEDSLMTYFFIRAGTDSTIVYYDSEVDSGFSCIGPPEQDLEIKSITDVPNDYGKQVKIVWYASKWDIGRVINYSIYRKIDARGSGIKDWPPGEWEFIETVPAWGESSYVAIAPTIEDSLMTYFFIRAGTRDTVVYYDSEVDSGFSVCNRIKIAFSVYNRTGIESQEEKLKFAAYPNPFNAEVKFTLEKGLIEIFDISGRKVDTVTKSVWNASRFASGIYFARYRNQVIRLLLIK